MANQSVKTRILCTFFIVLLVSFLPVVGSSAAPLLDPEDPPTPPDFAKDASTTAKLVQPGGTKATTLIPVLVEAIEKGDTFQLTYEVGIPPELLEETDKQSPIPAEWFPFTAYADNDSHNGCDSTVSVCALVTLYYVRSGSHGYYQKTTTRWTRSDPTVSMSNARLGAYCYAPWYPGSGTCNQQQFKNVGVPTSGTTYTLTPSFAGSSHQITYGAISGDQRITLKRGSSTWTFTFCVAYGEPGAYTGCY